MGKIIKISIRIFIIFISIIVLFSQKMEKVLLKKYPKFYEYKINSEYLKKALKNENDVYKVFEKKHFIETKEKVEVIMREISNNNFDCPNCGAILEIEIKTKEKTFVKYIGPIGSFSRLPKYEISRSGEESLNIYLFPGSVNNGELYMSLEVYTFINNNISKSLKIDEYSYDSKMSMLPVKTNHSSKYSYMYKELNDQFYKLKIVDSGTILLNNEVKKILIPKNYKFDGVEYKLE